MPISIPMMVARRISIKLYVLALFSVSESSMIASNWLNDFDGLSSFDTIFMFEKITFLVFFFWTQRLANTIKADVVKKFQPNTSLPFKCMDNINSFLLALDQLEVPMEDRFQTVDLWERINLYSVQVCLSALARKAMKYGLKGFGPKEAEENKRQFTEEQLKQGESIINLQYGTNKGANASGIHFGRYNRL